ncbi:MAG: hypothetical protein Q3971_09105 [Moraxella sp.]|nr:hypothetical protein [Moraxella sp.]
MTDNQPTPNKDDLNKQTEQARRVLMRLQWLVIILLGSGIIWLYGVFSNINIQVHDKLTKIDTVDARLNSMDDRIFALTSLYGQKPNQQKPNHEQDSELIKIQLSLANQLYKQGNYDDTINALTAIRWQLPKLNGIATPVKNTLTDSLNADISYLTAQKNQPDAWQAHVVKMQDVQAFLRKHQNNTAGSLNNKDLLIHDASMLLSLAIGSANARDKATMTTYLQEVRTRLESHVILTDGKLSIGQVNPDIPTKNDNPKTTTPPLEAINDALYWVYELLANSPKEKPLKSMQILP